MDREMKSIKLAIIGCGAISANAHIPNASKSSYFDLQYLVDRNQKLAEELASQFDVSHVTQNYHEIIGKVDAAIIAVPHKFHYSIAMDLLEAGVHLLVEKPMALTDKDCQEMIRQAEQHDTHLVVGHFRRVQPVYQLAYEILQQKWFGDILSFEAKEGYVFASPVASPAMFSKQMGGGGVLLDTGPHLLDNLLWWFGDYEKVEYWDDNCGGVEADCLLRLQFKSGLKGTVKFSRLRDLTNIVKVICERGVLEIPIGHSEEITLKVNGSDYTGYLGGKKDSSGVGNVGYLLEEIERFAKLVLYKEPFFIKGEEAARTIQLIEECYANREELQELW